MLSLLITSLFLILFVLICLYDHYSHTSRLLRKIPGLKGYPIIGNSYHVILPLDKLFVFIPKVHDKLGDVFQMHAINARLISYLDPECIEAILSSSRFNAKNMPYSFLKPWLGEGLLISKGQKWLQRRKMLTQAFHFNILKQFFLTFQEKTNKLVNEFQALVGEKQIDIEPLVTTTTLRGMCETAMGTSMNESIESVASKYFKAIAIVGHVVIKRMCRIWLHLDCFFNLTKIAKDQKESLSELHTFTNKIIEERRTFLKENHIDTFDDGEMVYKKGRLAMLDLLLEKEKLGEIDVNGIREEIDTFLFAGHDTTARALTFFIMRIANETEIQNKIYEEMQSIFGDSQRKPTIEELNKMKYLECCIKESLRLYPSVPLIVRYVDEEMTVGGYTIPANSHILIHIYKLHRREDIYPDPERFIPERFLPEACSKRHPYAYIPFSAGPRNCIGQKFAMLEMKTLLSSLFRRFRLEPVTKTSDIKFKSDILLRTVNNSIYVKAFNRC